MKWILVTFSGATVLLSALTDRVAPYKRVPGGSGEES